MPCQCQKRRNVIQKLLSIIEELVQIIENGRLDMLKYHEEDKVACTETFN